MLYQTLHDGEIRLLRLEPSQNQTSLPRATLEKHSLATAPSYQCLSYTWGHASSKQHIAVDGHDIAVTANLLDAIITVRGASLPVWLWIDKISINQRDVEERGRQVKLMRSIYTHAEVVNIWLGSDIPGTAEAFELLGELVHSPFRLSEALLEDGESQTARVRIIRKLFESSWWTRLWIIQEALLAKTAIVYCGPNSIPFNAVMQAFESIWNLHISQGQDLRDIPSGHMVDPLIRQLEITARRLHVVHNFVYTQDAAGLKTLRKSRASLLFLLHSCAWAECTDPRDKVYGAMGLIDDQLFEPDYSLSVAQVYTKSAFAIIKATGDLAILTQALPRPSGENSLPSWVPDWRVPSTLTAHLLVFHKLYNATKDSHIDVELADEKTLTIKAQELDEIVEIGPVFDTVDIDNSADLPKRIRPVLQCWSKTFAAASDRRSEASVAKRNSHSLQSNVRPVYRSPPPPITSFRADIYRDSKPSTTTPAAYFPMQSMQAPVYKDADYGVAPTTLNPPPSYSTGESFRAREYTDTIDSVHRSPDGRLKRTVLARKRRRDQDSALMDGIMNGTSPASHESPRKTPSSAYRVYDTSTHTYVDAPAVNPDPPPPSGPLHSTVKLQAVDRPDVSDAFWRALCMDVIDTPGAAGHRRCIYTDKARFCTWFDWIMNTSDSLASTIPQLHWHLNVVLQQKRAFRTKGGLVGVVGNEVQVGDEAFLLKGERIPVLLRRVGEERYQFVASGYVHCSMDGEAVSGEWRNIMIV